MASDATPPSKPSPPPSSAILPAVTVPESPQPAVTPDASAATPADAEAAATPADAEAAASPADATAASTPAEAATAATPSAASADVTATVPVPVTPRPPEVDADVIHIPSYSRWFSWNVVHECEVRFVPEFFDGRSFSKNPRVYKCYRNAIIKRFRDNPTRKITFTEVRKTIIGDVGSIRRVFDFLEAWGLINYTGSNLKQSLLKWEDKEAKSNSAAAQVSDGVTGGGSGNIDISTLKNRLCNGCKNPCSVARFISDKHDMVLCARCYVRGNYRVGLNSSDFKRVDISEDAKADWTDKETLQLLEAVMHYGDDWKKVAEHVGGKGVKECLSRFLKLPFGEQFDGPPESSELDAELGLQNVETPAKRMRLSPLADASNPIMAQAAFLSTLVGVDVAEVAARAAVTALSDLGDEKHQERMKISPNMEKESDIASNGSQPITMGVPLVDAQLQLDKEEEELEKSISSIAVQIKEIEKKIVHFEEFDFQIETKWKQLQQLQNLLFIDQLSLVFHKSDAVSMNENTAADAQKNE